MRVSFTGNFKALEEFAGDVARLPDSLRTVSEQLAEETIELIHEGFEHERDPYGRKWKKHSKLTQLIRPGGRILQGPTAGLRTSWFRKGVSSDGFEVASAKAYAIFHQAGTGIYGPKKKSIKPVRAKALRIPVGNGAIILSQVQGAPKRRMVPENGRIPKAWSTRYVETAQEVLTEIFR